MAACDLDASETLKGIQKSFTDKQWLTSTHISEAKSNTEYAIVIGEWLRQCYFWHCVHASFPTFLVNQVHHFNWEHFDFTGSVPPRTSTAFASRSTAPHAQVPNTTRGTVDALSTAPVLTQLGGREYKVPRVWKRFTAEFVDFAILFLLKLFITFIVMDFFDMIDLEKYDLGALQGSTLDYKFALQITWEIFVLELIHRVVVCFFEALCLHQGTNGVGGATPGKSLLGIRVVSCETIVHLQGTRIVVWPAGDMGFGWALLRSVIKNFAMAFFFPACVTMFFFPYHRTVYDMLCGCIVVEDVRPQNQF